MQRRHSRWAQAASGRRVKRVRQWALERRQAQWSIAASHTTTGGSTAANIASSIECSRDDAMPLTTGHGHHDK
jgi:hypothetical protein